MAAQLWGAPTAIVSHRSAGRLFGLEGVPDGFIELLTPGAYARPPTGVTLHRTGVLAKTDHGTRGPFVVTGILRTLIDLGAVLEPHLVEVAFECAVRRDPSVLPRLAERVEGLDPRGSGGARVIKEILAARDPAAAPSEGVFETLFERTLREAGLPLPVRQHELVVGGVAARIDFAYPKNRIAIETDGYWCHSGRRRWQRGLARNNALIAAGWRPLHVTWEDLNQRPVETMASVRKALEVPARNPVRNRAEGMT